MSDAETPGQPGPAAVDAGFPLTQLLDGFERWLAQQPALTDGPGDRIGAGPDLSTLLREFIGLRQEINLLTRAARTQQEQNASTLSELAGALEQLRGRGEQTASEPAGKGPPDENRQLNLKQLVEVRDALARAEREMQKARASLEQVLTEVVATDPEEPPLPEPPPVEQVPWLARWLGVRGPDPAAWQEYARAFAERVAEQRQRREVAVQARQVLLTRVRQILGSLLEGYAMSLQRLDRLLVAHELEPIAAEGARFDPERMEALESVLGSGKPAGEVVEEVRRGYLQRGRVFRFALVRVARDG